MSCDFKTAGIFTDGKPEAEIRHIVGHIVGHKISHRQCLGSSLDLSMHRAQDLRGRLWHLPHPRLQALLLFSSSVFQRQVGDQLSQGK